MKREANLYGLNMLPLYVEISSGQLESSVEQLDNLELAKGKPHVLDSETIERPIKLHRSQNNDNWVFFEQCKKWRDNNPDNEQLSQIAEVENNTSKLESINNEILKLAESFKGKTIDDVMAKDDAELGLEWLLNAISIDVHNK